MRILYLTQWFEPEPMIKGVKFVRGLQDLGHEVEVVTGFPNYPTGKVYPGYKVKLYRREEIDGIVVHRLALYPSHDRSSFRRSLNYLSFMVTCAIFAAGRARRYDVIYSYPPITVGLAAAFAGWISRRPFVLDIQDLWPDSVVKSGMGGGARLEGVLNLMCNFTYRAAARIIVQSKGMKRVLIERGVPGSKIDVVYNWADEDAARPGSGADLAPYGFAGKFNVVYGGNLGRVQGLDTLVKAAHAAAAEVPSLQLLLIGDGIEGDSLRALVGELGAKNVRIAPGVPRAQIGDIFAAADVLVLHLWDDPLFEITIPQKTQFYMAMGKPVLIGVKGEAAEFITAAGAGVAAPPQDEGAIAGAMVRLARMPKGELQEMGKRGNEAYYRSCSFAEGIDRTHATLKSVSGKKAGRAQDA
jgi:colanic acid biosynthesis glycosyl transferase WcaI